MTPLPACFRAPNWLTESSIRATRVCRELRVREVDSTSSCGHRQHRIRKSGQDCCAAESLGRSLETAGIQKADTRVQSPGSQLLCPGSSDLEEHPTRDAEGEGAQVDFLTARVRIRGVHLRDKLSGDAAREREAVRSGWKKQVPARDVNERITRHAVLEVDQDRLLCSHDRVARPAVPLDY